MNYQQANQFLENYDKITIKNMCYMIYYKSFERHRNEVLL